MSELSYTDILKKYWGYPCFRPNQLEAIEIVSKGSDALVLMPTGAGKSLIYQVPAIKSEGLCIVVSPLISLMKDQTDRLRSLGIKAAAIHSGLTSRQIDYILDNCVWGDIKFLYISPERISSPAFRLRIGNAKVNLIAVDEAHCISQWGYDFRPSYLKIRELRDLLPGVPLLALTASATGSVTGDIKEKLGMPQAPVVRSSYYRPNLSYAVRHTDDKNGMVVRIVENVPGSGIIYCRTRSATETLCNWLNEQDIKADFYHGGLTPQERTAKQESWIGGKSRVMVATNAFGMGIDKKDVRFVVHYDTPSSLEEYYQEAGRAGRDGKRSYAVLLNSSDDKTRSLRKHISAFPPLETIKSVYDGLFNYLQIGIGGGRHMSFEINLYELARRLGSHISTVSNAIKIIQQNGYLEYEEDSDNPPMIRFLTGRDDLYRVRVDRTDLEHMITTILRLYTGLFHGRFVRINIEELAYSSGYDRQKSTELLKNLWDLRIIEYRPANRSPMVVMHEERLPPEDLYISPESYGLRKDIYEGRLKSMWEYVEDSSSCRNLIISRYFGEETDKQCGCCDTCLAGKREGSSADLRQQVEGLIGEGQYSVKELIKQFGLPPDQIIAVIDELSAQGNIRITKSGLLEVIA